MTRMLSILTIALLFVVSYTASAQTLTKMLAVTGNAQAQYEIGKVYYNGEGVEQDYVEATRWYRLAAEQGHAKAQNRLGIAYANGEGVEQDYVEATRWWRLVAEQGHAKAQNRLGIAYENGKGVPQDFVYSHMWSNISASLSGNTDAAQRRDKVAEIMTPTQIALAQQLARECVRREYKDC